MAAGPTWASRAAGVCAGWFLDRDSDGVGGAFVAEVGQAGQVLRGGFGDRGQDVVVAGGAVLASGSYLGGPQWPAVGCEDDMDVAAVLGDACPTTTGPLRVSGRAWRPVGVDQRAVEGDVAVPGGLRGQQRPVRTRSAFGERVDAFVQVPVGVDPVGLVNPVWLRCLGILVDQSAEDRSSDDSGVGWVDDFLPRPNG